VTESTTSNEGFLAFIAFALLALALWFLMRNMNARMRRMSYRQQAAHRGKDEPQAGPEDLRDEGDGDDPEDVVGEERADGPDGEGPAGSADGERPGPV
jgi:hypothetical protein